MTQWAFMTKFWCVSMHMWLRIKSFWSECEWSIHHLHWTLNSIIIFLDHLYNSLFYLIHQQFLSNFTKHILYIWISFQFHLVLVRVKSSFFWICYVMLRYASVFWFFLRTLRCIVLYCIVFSSIRFPGSLESPKIAKE